MNTKYMQGFFKPKNPSKYKGNVENIVFRSSLEYKYYRYFDINQSILEWSSEEVVVPYINPIDNRQHRYFIDAFVTIKTKSGEIKKVLIELKPYSQTFEPKPQKRITPQFRRRVAEYLINKSKWIAAEKFAESKGYKFMVLTERDI